MSQAAANLRRVAIGVALLDGGYCAVEDLQGVCGVSKSTVYAYRKERRAELPRLPPGALAPHLGKPITEDTLRAIFGAPHALDEALTPLPAAAAEGDEEAPDVPFDAWCPAYAAERGSTQVDAAAAVDAGEPGERADAWVFPTPCELAALIGGDTTGAELAALVLLGARAAVDVEAEDAGTQPEPGAGERRALALLGAAVALLAEIVPASGSTVASSAARRGRDASGVAA
jgi:hypothetical protein